MNILLKLKILPIHEFTLLGIFILHMYIFTLQQLQCWHKAYFHERSEEHDHILYFVVLLMKRKLPKEDPADPPK